MAQTASGGASYRKSSQKSTPKGNAQVNGHPSACSGDLRRQSLPAAETRAGVRSRRLSITDAARSSASRSGGKCVFGTALTGIPADAAARIPLLESSIATQPSGAAPRPRAAARYTSGAGLPRATSSDETVTRKAARNPLLSRNSSMIGRFEDDARPSG